MAQQNTISSTPSPSEQDARYNSSHDRAGLQQDHPTKVQTYPSEC